MSPMRVARSCHCAHPASLTVARQPSPPSRCIQVSCTDEAGCLGEAQNLTAAVVDDCPSCSATELQLNTFAFRHAQCWLRLWRLSASLGARLLLSIENLHVCCWT